MRAGILIVGLSGATANTFATSLALAGDPTHRVFGALSENEEFSHLGLARCDDVVVSGWDFSSLSVFESATQFGIIPHSLIENAQNRLGVRPKPAVASRQDPELLTEKTQVRECSNYVEAVEEIQNDIEEFKSLNQLDFCLVLNLISPQKEFPRAILSASGRADFENGINQQGKGNFPASLVYAHAAIRTGCGFIDFTTAQSLEVPFIQRLSEERTVPIAGRDGSTGQTYLKLGLATLLRLRGLRIEGWYSANILGNQDGFVLTQNEFDQVKKKDKTESLNEFADLSDENHVVDISYYRPRGDNKEAWDSVDISGWFGLGMQMKINWIGRDSILAGPLLLDLCRFSLHSLATGAYGVQNQLNFYFKSPLERRVFSPFEEYRALVSYYS